MRNLLTLGVYGLSAPSEAAYKALVATGWPHIGDIIEKERKLRRWNQRELGLRAAAFTIHPHEGPINKSTVSKVENDPFTSELGTVWRLLATLGLSFSEIEKRTTSPVIQRKESAAGEKLRRGVGGQRARAPAGRRPA